MKTVNIKGKEYVMVKDRVMEFRTKYLKHALITNIYFIDDKSIIMKCEIKNENGIVISTGYAQETFNSSMINRTSAIENCETSAVGRALGFLGIGIDANISSADEVEGALSREVMEAGKSMETKSGKKINITKSDEKHKDETEEERNKRYKEIIALKNKFYEMIIDKISDKITFLEKPRKLLFEKELGKLLFNNDDWHQWSRKDLGLKINLLQKETHDKDYLNELRAKTIEQISSLINKF